MASKSYRYYRLDCAGYLHDAEWFDAPNDDDAIARIAAMHPDEKCEVWREKRLVAALLPKRLSA